MFHLHGMLLGEHPVFTLTVYYGKNVIYSMMIWILCLVYIYSLLHQGFPQLKKTGSAKTIKRIDGGLKAVFY